VGKDVGVVVGIAVVGESEWWLHAPATASNAPSISSCVVVNPVRQLLDSRSHPHLNTEPSGVTISLTQSIEHVVTKQGSVVGEVVGACVGVTVGTPVGSRVGGVDGENVGDIVGDVVGVEAVGLAEGAVVGTSVVHSHV
jgi:hypothetical protein